jgi:hypothetical protein
VNKKNKSLLLLSAGAAGAYLVYDHLTSPKGFSVLSKVTGRPSLFASGWGDYVAPPYGRLYSQPWGYGTPWNPSLEPWMQYW